jgi:hypothetical protein
VSHFLTLFIVFTYFFLDNQQPDNWPYFCLLPDTRNNNLRFIMFVKPVATLLLALGATSASAAYSYGNPLYIQDATAPVEITYSFRDADDTHLYTVYQLDANGSILGSAIALFGGRQSSSTNVSSFVGQTFTLNLNPNATQLVFGLYDLTTRNQWYSDPSRNAYNAVQSHEFETSTGITLAWEDRYKFDQDFNDAIFKITNLGLTKPIPPQPPIPGVPEPETYAMLLAGLGLVGVAARRRRDQVRR